ncbi:hypothetical protein [Actinocrinis sp.]|uniref:hypothetical protein n=1 Tax=Actinocrinis sp. TaxID=1920516 RepID=UPI002C0167C8|nr:hypothetical protein [Actinocrinis sp.]HXR71262.1 hypothetical protein [Actinocrinis sp.]
MEADAGATIVAVPRAAEERVAPPAASRVRKLRQHLLEALNDLRKTWRADAPVERPAPEPEGFAGDVVREACGQCRGFCCKGGGEHAYLDDRTMARVLRDHPDLSASSLVRRYLDAVAAESVVGSCLYHGRQGCTLPRTLRADLCNIFYCNGLRVFLRSEDTVDRVIVVAEGGGQARRSVVMRRDSTEGLATGE